MNIKREPGKYAFSASAALLLAMGVMASNATAEPELFTGVATLCAISPEVISPPEQKGRQGVIVQYDMGFIYLIRSEDSASLMNGWEVTNNNWKKTRRDVEFYWGHTELIPFGYEGTGALEEDFKFKAEDILNGYSGTFAGTGALEGVTVDFELSPPYEGSVSEFPLECYDVSALCDDCFPALQPGEDEIPGTDDDKFIQYDMNGWINGYDPQ